MKPTFKTTAAFIAIFFITLNATFAFTPSFAQSTGFTAVPVKYISFEGNVNNKSVVLTWVTEETATPDYFEVERSFNGVDFTKVGIVLDGFTDGGQMAYAFKESAEAIRARGTVYYRLNPVYLKETGVVSKTIAVQFKEEGTNTTSVTPNPFSEKINMKFTASQSGTAEVRIVNANGTTVVNKTFTVSKGPNNLPINNLTALPSGTYIAAVVMNGSQVAVQTVVK